MKVGTKVRMVDRYGQRMGGKYRSWFDGEEGVVTSLQPMVMVLLVGERQPMRFDPRDFDVLDEVSQVSMTGAE